MRTRTATILGAEVVVVMREEAQLHVTSLPTDLDLMAMRDLLMAALTALDQQLVAQYAPVATEEPIHDPTTAPEKRPRP